MGGAGIIPSLQGSPPRYGGQDSTHPSRPPGRRPFEHTRTHRPQALSPSAPHPSLLHRQHIRSLQARRRPGARRHRTASLTPTPRGRGARRGNSRPAATASIRGTSAVRPRPGGMSRKHSLNCAIDGVPSTRRPTRSFPRLSSTRLVWPMVRTHVPNASDPHSPWSNNTPTSCTPCCARSSCTGSTSRSGP